MDSLSGWQVLHMFSWPVSEVRASTAGNGKWKPLKLPPPSCQDHMNGTHHTPGAGAEINVETKSLEGKVTQLGIWQRRESVSQAPRWVQGEGMLWRKPGAWEGL